MLTKEYPLGLSLDEIFNQVNDSCSGVKNNLHKILRDCKKDT
jgi:hypothetical protein